MDNILQAVVASTFATNQQFIPERTPILLKEESVREICKQINTRRFNGAPVGFFLHPPQKSNQKQHNLALQTSLVLDRGEAQSQRQNANIGDLVSAELQEDKQFNILKCVATIYFKDTEALKSKKIISMKSVQCLSMM